MPYVFIGTIVFYLGHGLYMLYPFYILLFLLNQANPFSLNHILLMTQIKKQRKADSQYMQKMYNT